MLKVLQEEVRYRTSSNIAYDKGEYFNENYHAFEQNRHIYIARSTYNDPNSTGRDVADMRIIRLLFDIRLRIRKI